MPFLLADWVPHPPLTPTHKNLSYNLWTLDSASTETRRVQFPDPSCGPKFSSTWQFLARNLVFLKSELVLTTFPVLIRKEVSSKKCKQTIRHQNLALGPPPKSKLSQRCLKNAHPLAGPRQHDCPVRVLFLVTPPL